MRVTSGNEFVADSDARRLGYAKEIRSRLAGWLTMPAPGWLSMGDPAWLSMGDPEWLSFPDPGGSVWGDR